MKRWMLAAVTLLGTAAALGAPEWTSAKIVKIDAQRARVTLDHARIRSIGMEAMVMPFKVGKRVDLQRFQPGDQVRFVVSTQGDHLVVEQMEKAK